ncbi:MAG: dihydroorotate dehydrogenase [Candidatus Latescibacteria bacterium]|nr:dihydroorotate dehydrogenase [Candidatus Latescibacterota bacterium]NIM22310.1 dihydroorotate dehydrogenase [Candidatus Latescibacterota bacterium]NIM66139.1 dihydroorotate dehydrogenase [Candidatus Latescibacterota bacterium]NIO02547.1 dihydroorotate dehydrogenase [Candidatus Latescibacterota bacterium]NIO29461.1 dihydroorotate dehydrogenase [Candidatus Latescibacterota bacterium]
MSASNNDISVKIGPVAFKNPVFLASGICGYGEEYASIIPQKKLGGIVTKTITLEPRAGNPPPRIRELPTGALNSIGLENVGLDAYIREKLPLLKDLEVDAVVSITAETEDEFTRIAEAFAPLEGYRGIELNLSCPNVEGTALDHGRDPAYVEKITSIVKERIPKKTLWVKITPNLADVGLVARAAEAGGADAISAVNTVIGTDFDLSTGKPIFARVGAGYSGPGILPIALFKVWEVAHSVSIPVVGIGGISSVEDARKFFLAGAIAVQVGTALYSDPELPIRIVEALRAHPEWARREGGST